MSLFPFHIIFLCPTEALGTSPRVDLRKDPCDGVTRFRLFDLLRRQPKKF